MADEFLLLLPRLANKDKTLKDPNTKFFESSKVETELDQDEQQQKPIYYKDLVRQEILEKMDKDTLDEEEVEGERKQINYDELPIAQQEKKAKEEFLKAATIVDESGDVDGLLKKRKRTQEEKDEEQNEYLRFLNERRELKDKGNKLLKNYWLNDSLNEEDKFLRNYIVHKGWVDKEQERAPTYEELVTDADVDDEEILDEQDRFEHVYNFRYEEPDSVFIPTFQRNPVDSVRRPDERRKATREKRKTKKLREQKQKEDEKKHLMKLKQIQIHDRLKTISEISGTTDDKLKNVDLGEAFDPEAHDKQMATLFDDTYYNEKNDQERPTFKDDDLEGEGQKNQI